MYMTPQTSLRKLQSIDHLPDYSILTTMDIESLYTNIPHWDGLQATINIIPANTTTNLASKLYVFVLTNNYFRFDEIVNLQISEVISPCGSHERSFWRFQLRLQEYRGMWGK